MTDAQLAMLDAAVARIDNLEMRIAYQDETIENLNEAVIRQWSRLDEALARIKLLEARIREVQLSATRDASEETPPPHY